MTQLKIRNPIKCLLVLGCLLYLPSHQASAEPNFRIGGFLRGVQGIVVEQNIERLVEASAQITRAASQSSRPAIAEAQLRIAGYRVALVLATLRSGNFSQARGALEVTREKLQDRYLPLRDKIEISLDCIGVAISDLVEGLGRQGNIRGAAKALQFVKLVAERNMFGPAVQVLGSVESTLLRSNARGVRQAIDAIQIAIAKARDPYLSGAQKRYFVLDCVNVALRSL